MSARTSLLPAGRHGIAARDVELLVLLPLDPGIGLYVQRLVVRRAGPDGSAPLPAMQSPGAARMTLSVIPSSDPQQARIHFSVSTLAKRWVPASRRDLRAWLWAKTNKNIELKSALLRHGLGGRAASLARPPGARPASPRCHRRFRLRRRKCRLCLRPGPRRGGSDRRSAARPERSSRDRLCRFQQQVGRPVNMIVSPLSRISKPCALMSPEGPCPRPGRCPWRCCRRHRLRAVSVTKRVPFWCTRVTSPNRSRSCACD